MTVTIKRQIFSSLLSVGLMWGICANPTLAKMPNHQAQQFEKIEQPLLLKLGVSLIGLGLIGLELWWFVFNESEQ